MLLFDDKIGSIGSVFSEKKNPAHNTSAREDSVSRPLPAWSVPIYERGNRGTELALKLLPELSQYVYCLLGIL